MSGKGTAADASAYRRDYDLFRDRKLRLTILLQIDCRLLGVVRRGVEKSKSCFSIHEKRYNILTARRKNNRVWPRSLRTAAQRKALAL